MAPSLTQPGPLAADAPAPLGARLGVADLLSPQAYGLLRRTCQPRLIAHRKARTATLGPWMRLQFEDVLTVRYQVQEVLRAERIGDVDAMQRELDTYRHLLPDGTGWKATLLIALPDAAERARTLAALSRAAHAVYAEVAGRRAMALANEDLPCRHLERPSGVHFLRFALPAAMRTALRAGAAVTLGCADAQYPWRQALAPALLAQLRGDLLARPAPNFTFSLS